MLNGQSTPVRSFRWYYVLDDRRLFRTNRLFPPEIVRIEKRNALSTQRRDSRNGRVRNEKTTRSATYRFDSVITRWRFGTVYFLQCFRYERAHSRIEQGAIEISRFLRWPRGKFNEIEIINYSPRSAMYR